MNDDKRFICADCGEHIVDCCCERPLTPAEAAMAERVWDQVAKRFGIIVPSRERRAE